MKKLFAILLSLLLILSLAACGNMAGPFDMGNFTFTHLHSDTYHNPMCFTITKWYDNSTGIEVVTEECGTLYFSEGDYVLIENASKCPYCQGGELFEPGAPQN